MVVIPNGTYSWTGTLTVRKSLALAGASASGVIIQNNLASGDMISAKSSANGNINIYWLDIQQVANNGGGYGYMIGADRTEPSPYTVMIHDCTLDTQTIFGYAVTAYDNGIIFWNDNFPATGAAPTNLTGIQFSCGKYGYTSSWNTPDSYGTEDTTGLMNSYVENCSFSGGQSCCSNFDDNSRVVWRYNTIYDSLIGMHGQESSPYGCREWEIYNNTFIATPGNPHNNQGWAGLRGGSGVVWGNSMEDIGAGKSAIIFDVFAITRSPCQTGYPAARQVGQGWSASSTATYGNPVIPQDRIGAVTEGVYIWNNTGAATTDPDFIELNPDPDGECGNGQLISNYVQEGRDYFLGTAKPNYSPYQYPHPLHTAFAARLQVQALPRHQIRTPRH